MQQENNDMLLALVGKEDTENSLNISSVNQKKVRVRDNVESKGPSPPYPTTASLRNEVRLRFASYADDRNWEAAVFWGEILLGLSSMHTYLEILLDTTDDSRLLIALAYFHTKQFRQALDILLPLCGNERTFSIKRLALILECYVNFSTNFHRLNWRNFPQLMNFWNEIALYLIVFKTKKRRPR